MVDLRTALKLVCLHLIVVVGSHLTLCVESLLLCKLGLVSHFGKADRGETESDKDLIIIHASYVS